MKYFIILFAFFICSFDAKAYEWKKVEWKVEANKSYVVFSYVNETKADLYCKGYMMIHTTEGEIRHKEYKGYIEPGYFSIVVNTFAKRELVGGSTEVRCRF